MLDALSFSALQARFAQPGVTFESAENGLIRIAVATETAEAHVYLHGAHVTHFRPASGKPILFLSRQSRFEPGKAIRGGIPLIFPWFGPKTGDPAAPAHGFARTRAWDVREIRRETGGAVTITLALEPDDASRRAWPFEFALSYAVTVGESLKLALTVQNLGASPITFEEAFHTYLSVSDVRRVTVDGLGGREYLDKPDAGRRKTQPPGAFPIEGETDRVYVDTPDTVLVNDPPPRDGDSGRVLSVAKEGSLATVVWNPWTAKAAALADFGDEEWPTMLCIETANAADNAVTLAAGESHVMRAAIGKAR